MFDILELLFSWMPGNLSVLAVAFIVLFVLAFFISIILKILDIIRG